MHRILGPAFNKPVILHSISILLERAMYYGFRSILVIVLMLQGLQLDEEKSLEIYGWFVASYLVTFATGAILGDLVLGSRRAMSLGLILQMIGVGCAFFPSLDLLYTGLVLISVGAGLYRPNFYASFGKLFHNKVDRIESGFLLVLMCVNVGASIVGVVIGSVYWLEENSLLMIILLGFGLTSLIVLRNGTSGKENVTHYVQGISTKNRTILLLWTVVVSGLYWLVYDFAQVSSFNLASHFNEPMIIEVTNSSLSMVFLAVFFAIAYWIYKSPMVGIIGGVLVILAALGVFVYAEGLDQSTALPLALAGVVLLSLTDALLTPAMYTLYVRYTNPKYFAMVFAVLMVLGSALHYFPKDEIGKNAIWLYLALITSTVGFAFWYRKFIAKKEVVVSRPISKEPDIIDHLNP